MTARPTAPSLRICVWLPHTHTIHSPCSSRSTTFLLIVVALVLIGSTAITTAFNVRRLLHVSLGTDCKSQVSVNCCTVTLNCCNANYVLTDDSGLGGDVWRKASAGLPLGTTALGGVTGVSVQSAATLSVGMVSGSFLLLMVRVCHACLLSWSWIFGDIVRSRYQPCVQELWRSVASRAYSMGLFCTATNCALFLLLCIRAGKLSFYWYCFLVSCIFCAVLGIKVV
jgi:hypothetical protein